MQAFNLAQLGAFVQIKHALNEVALVMSAAFKDSNPDNIMFSCMGDSTTELSPAAEEVGRNVGNYFTDEGRQALLAYAKTFPEQCKFMTLNGVHHVVICSDNHLNFIQKFVGDDTWTHHDVCIKVIDQLNWEAYSNL